MRKKILTHAEVARRGGLTTKRRHGGRKYYQQIAKKRWSKVKTKAATK